MRRGRLILVSVAVVLAGAWATSAAQGQVVVGPSVVAYSPVSPVYSYTYSPVMVDAPVVAAPVTTYYAPVPVTAYYGVPPVRTYYASPPVVTYRVPGPSYPLVYGPVVPSYSAPGVVVRPKVYVPGQPVRNVLRAITP
jgi:hypothetical protein